MKRTALALILAVTAFATSAWGIMQEDTMSGIGDMERMVKLTGEKMRYRRIPEWCKDEALPTLIKYFDQVSLKWVCYNVYPTTYSSYIPKVEGKEDKLRKQGYYIAGDMFSKISGDPLSNHRFYYCESESKRRISSANDLTLTMARKIHHDLQEVQDRVCGHAKDESKTVYRITNPDCHDKENMEALKDSFFMSDQTRYWTEKESSAAAAASRHQNVTSSLVVPPWEAKTKQYEDEGAFGEDGLPTADEDEKVCKARCVEKYDATEYHIVAVKKLDRKLKRSFKFMEKQFCKAREMDPRKYVFPQRCLPHQGMIIYSINNSIMPSLCDDDYDYDDEDERRIKRNKKGNKKNPPDPRQKGGQWVYDIPEECPDSVLDKFRDELDNLVKEIC